MADDVLGEIIPLRAVFFGGEFTAREIGPLGALLASPDIHLPEDTSELRAAHEGISLPLQIEFSIAYLDGALADEHPEILKQWQHIRRHLLGDVS